MTLTDKQKVFAALTLLRATCSDALTLLSDGEGVRNPIEESSFAVIHKDLLSLLSLIYASVTKLALALKPSSPTYSAALTPIKEITERIAALAHCALLIDPTIHGATLNREAIGRVKDIIDAISSLAHTFLTADTNPNVGEEYLTRTGAVHDLIDKGKELSVENIAAVRKRWTEDKASLEDGISELRGMIEESEAERSFDDQEEFDDGWDELGLGPARQMDGRELGRSKKAYTILRLTALLHKRVLQDILTTHASVSSEQALSIFDNLCSTSMALPASADDFIASLYAPQDTLNIRGAFQAFRNDISLLRSILKDNFLPTEDTLATQFEQMVVSHNGTSTSQLTAGPEKWFRTCFDQLDKAVQVLYGINSGRAGPISKNMEGLHVCNYLPR